MAFWKRLGKRASTDENTNRPFTANNKLHNNNVTRSMSLSTSGDLGDNTFNSLQPSPTTQRPVSKSLSQDLPNRDVGDLGDFNTPEPVRPWSRRSRLSKNLPEVLSDLTALSYFQQFLESKEANSYLTLLNDIKSYHILAASFTSMSTSNSSTNVSSPVVTSDGLLDSRWSPSKPLRLLKSTSSSSGFSDDTSSAEAFDSPGHKPNSKPVETDTMVHSLLSERRRIVQKYFDPDSSEYLPSIACLLRDSEPVDTMDGLLDVFQDVRVGVCNILERDYFAEYLHSEFHYRYQLELITGGKLLITDILHNDTCLFYFMEYMDQEGKRHWLEFWLAADNYRSQWNASNAPSDALVIYNKYFSLQATQPLGLADAIRSSIEENICMTNTGPGPDCFESALHVLLSAMDKKYIQPFLSSPIFCQYVNEIVSALKNSTFPLTRSKRSGSSSTICSEISGVSSSAISTSASNHQNVGNSIHPVALSNNAETSMIRLGNSISNESLLIDIRQLNDPDSLWHRKRTTLSLGRLTPLGRFYTEVEPLPDKKTGSKLSKAVRRFVFVEEDQEKEEAAWQTAEMIIRDVTAITFLYGDLTRRDSYALTNTHNPSIRIDDPASINDTE